MRTFFFIGFTSGVLACGGADPNGLTDGGGGDGMAASDASVDGASGNPDAAVDAPINDAAGDAGALDGTTAVDAGPCTGTWTSCATCLTSSCALQLSACNANNACKNGFAALAMCKSMCGGNCDGTFENAGGQLAKNVLDCGKNNCNVCGF